MSLLTAFPCARIELVSEPGITAGIEKLRAEALDIFQAGVAEADPARAVERALGAAGSLPVPGPGGVIRAVAFGKAACSMGQALGAVIAEAGLGWSGLAVVFGTVGFLDFMESWS